MHDTKRVETIPGLQMSWPVARVTLDPTGERVDRWVEHDTDTRWSCPECWQELPCLDHRSLWRQWRGARPHAEGSGRSARVPGEGATGAWAVERTRDL